LEKGIVNLIYLGSNTKYQIIGNIRVVNEEAVPFLRIKKKRINKELEIR